MNKIHDNTTDIKAVRVISEECAPKMQETTNGSRSEVSSKVNHVRHGPFKKRGFVSVYLHVILSDNTERILIKLCIGVEYSHVINPLKFSLHPPVSSRSTL